MNDKHKLLLVGAGAHSHVVIDILLQNEEYDIIGCLDYDYDENHKRVVYGIPVIGNDEKLQEIYKTELLKYILHWVIINFAVSSSVSQQLQALNQYLLSVEMLLFRQAIIGRGTVIMPGAVINAGQK